MMNDPSHTYLRAGVREADHLDGRDGVDHHLGQGVLVQGRCAEGCALLERFLERMMMMRRNQSGRHAWIAYLYRYIVVVVCCCC